MTERTKAIKAKMTNQSKATKSTSKDIANSELAQKYNGGYNLNEEDDEFQMAGDGLSEFNEHLDRHVVEETASPINRNVALRMANLRNPMLAKTLNRFGQFYFQVYPNKQALWRNESVGDVNR